LDTATSPPVDIVPISRLFCSPTNPRRNDAAVPHVAASIRRFGWQQPMVARRTGEVIAGNTRLKAAQQLGMTKVPVWWFDGTDLDAVGFAVARGGRRRGGREGDRSLQAGRSATRRRPTHGCGLGAHRARTLFGHKKGHDVAEVMALLDRVQRRDDEEGEEALRALCEMAMAGRF